MEAEALDKSLEARSGAELVQHGLDIGKAKILLASLEFFKQ